jgi:hypothetical protein
MRLECSVIKITNSQSIFGHKFLNLIERRVWQAVDVIYRLNSFKQNFRERTKECILIIYFCIPIDNYSFNPVVKVYYVEYQ